MIFVAANVERLLVFLIAGISAYSKKKKTNQYIPANMLMFICMYSTSIDVYISIEKIKYIYDI